MVDENGRYIELQLDDRCNCKQEYSIEEHGENMALYFGRCNHRHGMNLCTISDIASNCHLDVIEGLLNRGTTR